MSLERYRGVVPDWDAFRAHARRPEPTTFRVREGRTPGDVVPRRLEAKGFRLKDLEALPRFYRVEAGPRAVTHTLEHWLGLVNVQQAVPGLAAQALGPRPGERVAGRFGVGEERLGSAGWLVRGNSIWGHTCDEWPVEAWPADAEWRYVCTGLRAVKEDPRFGDRVTNDALRWREDDA